MRHPVSRIVNESVGLDDATPLYLRLANTSTGVIMCHVIESVPSGRFRTADPNQMKSDS